MRVPLIGGYYVGRSTISSAARCLNLYPEKNQEGAPAPYIDLCTPGTTPLGQPPTPGPARGLFAASSGDLYAVVGSTVYYIDPTWAFHALGTIGTAAGMTSATDNGTDFLLVDSSSAGYQIELPTRVMTQVTDPNFFGAVRVDNIDSYILGNIPGTDTFFSSNLNALVFDPLYIANKSGASDQLATLVVVNRQIYLIGKATTEIWFNAGNPDFPFQLMPGPFMQYGCQAPYSIAHMGSDIFFVGQDLTGGRLILKGRGYTADNIATPAIMDAIRQYSVVSDAIGFCYQQDGHQFYMVTFPTADKTWCYDVTVGLWHERAWIDANGAEHRHRAACGAYAYGTNVVADWETGALYALDLDAYTDNGSPIMRRRGFPHMIEDADRIKYIEFIADMQTGESVGTTPAQDPQNLLIAPGMTFDLLSGPANPGTAPQATLRWSDDRGATWGNGVMRSMGASGEYIVSMQWLRLGLARDRVFELSWSEPVKTALQGAFITSKKLGS